MIKKVIVICGIVLLLILMLIPSFISAKFGERENLVKGRLRTLYEACELYRRVHEPAEYPATLGELLKVEPSVIDQRLVAPKQGGYEFIYLREPNDKFTVTAKPIFKFLTGYHTFFVDETGIIRMNNVQGDPIDA